MSTLNWLELGVTGFLLVFSYRCLLRPFSFGEPIHLWWLGVWVIGYIIDLTIIANNETSTSFILALVFLPLASYFLSILGFVNRMADASRKEKLKAKPHRP